MSVLHRATHSATALLVAAFGMTAVPAYAQDAPAAADRAATAAAPTAAAVQPVGEGMPPAGFYIGVSAGTQERAIGEDVNLGTAAEWERGFGASAVLGYRTPFAVRVEFESSLLDNNNVGFHFPPFPNGFREESTGHVALRSLMLNAYLDVPVGRFAPSLSRLQPYVGFGIGATESAINGVTSETLQAGIPGVFAPTVLDTTSRFTRSWQARVGLGVQVTNRFEVFGGYRHFETELLRFRTVQFPIVDVVGANIEEFEAGIRVFIF
jgi:opacity protein-like surface antigen